MNVLNATEARQTAAWGTFLTAIGWDVEVIEGTYIFIRTIPLLHVSFIKIQHPKGPLPFRKIDQLARKRNTLFTVLEPHRLGYEEDEFRKHGYAISKLRYAHSATILIDLSKSEEALLKSFSENARRNLRKAEKQVKVRLRSLEGKDKTAQIELFYRLYVHTGKQKSFYVPPFSEVQAKMEAFAKTSVLLWAYEKKDVISNEEREKNPRGSLAKTRNDNGVENPIAVLWIGAVNDTLIYFHPANTQKGYDVLANYLLVWEAMKWGKRKNLKYFDFETAYDPRYPIENKKWQGYTEFKKKFGGEFIQFPPSYIKFYNPLMKLFYQFGTLFSK